MIKLDYTLETIEERKALVNKILETYPNPTEQYLESLADYLILCMEKQERKKRKILTENRMATVNKREMSFEGLASSLENGEDGIYNLITENKNTIFQPKVSITKNDLLTIPFLAQLREAINTWEAKLKTVSGRPAYIVKKALIEMRKDQYVIKNAYKKPINATKLINSKSYIKLDSKEWVTKSGDVYYSGISLLNPQVISIILCNYSKLKANSWDQFEGDTWYLMQDFDKLCDEALRPWPLYERIVQYKIDALQNIDIQMKIEEEFGVRHSLEYISSLWRNKIPNLIANYAQEQYLDWHYTMVEKGKYKKCSRCGQIKLANNRFFSKNNTSKDSFYSICKECRNKKEVKKK